MHVIVAPLPSSRVAAIAAGAVAATAALLSCGTIAFTGPSPALLAAGARLGILPLQLWQPLLAAAVGTVVSIAAARGRGWPALVAVSPLALVFLPWLPFPVPPAFLIWTGGMISLAWLAAASALYCAIGPASLWRRLAGRRSVPIAAALGFVVFGAAAWLASPSLPGGDEPHYLVITQSLLYDHDLQIENNHQRGDYRAYFAGDLNPDSIKRGRNGAVYSIHAPGVPALVLPAFAVAGYHGVVLFLLLAASAACALAWWLAWRVTGSPGAAWFGWAAVVFSAPWLLETYTVYPDALGGAIVLTGFWALLRAGWEQEGADPPSRPVVWLLHGTALALLPWMHTRFSVLAATLGGLILIRLARAPNPVVKAVAFLGPPAVSAVAWMFFFAVLYGAPDPSAPYGGRVDSSFAFLPDGLGGLLFDQGFGVLATAPMLVWVIPGFRRSRRLAVEWAAVAIPYLLAVTTFAMWWAGMSGPARFFVPLLPVLAIPAACAWQAAGSRGLRTAMLATLVMGAWLGAIMAGAGGGRLGYHTRNEAGLTAAPWMEWATRVVDLPSAAPAFVPQPVQPDPGGLVSRARAARGGFAATLVWLLALGAAMAAAVRWIDRHPGWPRERAVVVLTGAAAMAAMAACSVVWRLQAPPATVVAAQIDALRVLASSRVAAFDLTHHRRVAAADAWGMTLEIPVAARGGRGVRPPNRPLAAFSALPAGSYLLQVRRRGGGEGWVMAGIGNDQFAIATQPIAAFDAGVRLDLPVDVRAVSVRGDEGAREQLAAITLRPVARAAARLSTDAARRAVRYDRTVVYFLDERAFPEPGGFWVGGARDTTVVARRDQPGARLGMTLRNGAADNRVLLSSGAWRGDVALKAGEERRIEMPLDPASGTALVRLRSESGFRPSEIDGRSRDSRFLGVFVRVE